VISAGFGAIGSVEIAVAIGGKTVLARLKVLKRKLALVVGDGGNDNGILRPYRLRNDSGLAERLAGSRIAHRSGNGAIGWREQQSEESDREHM
jgi:hypothetical protein